MPAAAPIAALLVATLALTGCVTLFLPDRGRSDTVSTPTGEDVTADLEPYYSQVLTWTVCEETFQCATAEAPMDWSNPTGERIELALIRSTLADDPMGSLLLNPGGPGGSGYDFVRDSLDYAVSARLQDAYDIVGFDPRGVNRSSAVSCYTDPVELDTYLFDLPQYPRGSAEGIAESETSSAAFGQDCLANTGDLLGFVDTVSAARDLDLLRAVLGDEQLNYLGYSYGTELGATYAELYPDKTGRLVLDGAVDPSTSEFDVSKTQAMGFESALIAYLEDCLTGRDCPFDGTAAAAAQQVHDLLGALDQSPLRNDDGRLLGSGSMFTAIILPLYNQDNWPALDQLFTSVFAGRADIAFALADSYYQRSDDGTYLDNSTEAFIAINCLDYRVTSTVDSLEAEAQELERVAPIFGEQFAYGGTACADWPFQSTRDRGPIAAAGSGPIVVVGTTNDPATPYVWAQNLAAQLENGYLVTYDGEGHTAYNKSNACVNDAVDDYFVDGTVPETDPTC